MIMSMTLEDLEGREALLNMRADALPAVQRTIEAAEAVDLRTVRNPVEKERIRTIRELSRKLARELAATKR